jgi:hypothetical protein
MYVCMHVCMHACINTYTHTCTRTHTYMNTRIHICTYLQVLRQRALEWALGGCVPAHAHAYVHKCMHADVHVCMHWYITMEINDICTYRVCTCTHTHTHTHGFVCGISMERIRYATLQQLYMYSYNLCWLCMQTVGRRSVCFIMASFEHHERDLHSSAVEYYINIKCISLYSQKVRPMGIKYIGL